MIIGSGKKKSTAIELNVYEKDDNDVKLDSKARKCREIIKQFENNKINKMQMHMLFDMVVEQNLTWEKLKFAISKCCN